MTSAAATDSASIAAARLFSNGRAFGFLNVARSPSVSPRKSTTPSPPPSPPRTQPSRCPGRPPRGGRGPSGPHRAPSAPPRSFPTFPTSQNDGKDSPAAAGGLSFPPVLLGIFYQFKGCFSALSRSCHCFMSSCFTPWAEQLLAQARPEAPALLLRALQCLVGHLQALPQ